MPDRAELEQVISNALRRVAPESDPLAISRSADLRDALDIDSMDFLGFITALHSALGVDIPEPDYPKLFTLDSALEYLEAATRGR